MGIEVNPADVAQTAKTMEALAEDIEATMRNLMYRLDALPGSWQGRAAASWAQAQAAWQSKAIEHRRALNHASETLLGVSLRQGALEDANEQAAKGQLSAVQSTLG